MGDRRKYRKRFFIQHPLCCFCGGSTPIEEIDHQPPRVAFFGRQWPEGYDFPACKRCNSATRKDEQIFGMVSQFYDPQNEGSEQHKSEIRDRINAIANNFPGLLASMRASSRDIRSFFHHRNLKMPDGMTTHEAPIIHVDNPVIQKAMENCSGKLLCALHYRHTDRPLPSDGYVSVRWLTNVQIRDGVLPEEDLGFLRFVPTLQRARTPLSHQFDYRYVVTDDRDVSAFVCKFRESFYVFGFATAAPKSDIDEWATTSENSTVWRPYAWT